MAKVNAPAIFISAKQKINIDEFKKLLYDEVKKLHVIRYPYTSFLYWQLFPEKPTNPEGIGRETEVRSWKSGDRSCHWKIKFNHQVI